MTDKQWREKISKLIEVTAYIVGTASNKREDMGTERANPDSEYNKGYKDGSNSKNTEWVNKIKGLLA